MNTSTRPASVWLLLASISLILSACDSGDVPAADAGAVDSGAVDSGAMDSGAMDSGAMDSGAMTDASAADASSDAAAPDGSASADAGMEPLPTPDAFSPRRIAAYDRVACVVIDGRVACWGDNTDGQLGVTGEQTSPVEIPGVTGAVTVGVAEDAVCAVVDSGSVYCWGTDTEEELGGAAPGTVAGALAPTEVPGLSDVREVVGNWYNFCARRSDGSVQCWGDSFYGVLGDLSDASEAPVTIAGIDDAVEIEAANWSLVAYCALRASGRVSCWGHSRSTVTDMGISGASRLESVGNGFCARVGSDWQCWGSDVRDASTGGERPFFEPTVVPDYAGLEVLGGVPGEVSPSGTATMMCGVARSPEPHLACAGDALWIVTMTTRDFAEEDFTQLTSFGWEMLCGLTPAGGVRCLGDNGNHELGNPDAPSAGSAEPVDVTLPF